MSAERSLPAAAWPARTHLALTLVAAAVIGVTSACNGPGDSHVLMSRKAPGGAHVALVRLIPCTGGWCESLWIGSNAETATRIVTLPHAQEHSDEIAWSADAKRVAFLINGYQLRLYDVQTRAPAGLIDLVPPDATPTTRIARGITFSENGAAITFDDCPRDRSGCKPGIVGVR